MLLFIKAILCMLMLGLLIVLIGIEISLSLKKIQVNGIKSVGKIVGYNTDSDGDKTPIVEFLTINGELINASPLVYTSVNLIEVFTLNRMINKSVSILYDSEEPKRFIFMNENGNNYFTIFIIILVGLAFAILSVCNLLGYIKFG